MVVSTSQVLTHLVNGYLERGWYILPVHYTRENLCTCGDINCQNVGKHPRTQNGLHDATNDISVINQWIERWDNSLNFGLRTGAISNVFVLDIDNKTDSNGKTGFDSLNELTLKYGNLPDTLQVESGSLGRHFYFKHPGYEIRNIQDTRKVGYGIDIRGDGGYIIIPPSMHRVGKKYKWLNWGTPIANAPEWLLDLIKNKDTKVIQSGERNNKLFSIGAGLVAQGLPANELNGTLQIINKTQTNNPLDSKEVQRVAQSLERYPTGISLDDIGNGVRMCNAYGNIIRHCNEWGKWFVWDGKRWREDNTNLIEYLAKKVSKSIYAEAALENDRSRSIQLSKWAHDSSNTSRISAMIKMVTSEHDVGIPIKTESLDTDKMLFNVQNGTIDLRTQKLLPHDQPNLITKLSNVTYTPGIQPVMWLQFLDRVFRGQKDKDAIIAFLKRALGYSLTGSTREQVLFFLYGSGSNGKSTFIDTIQHILGDYACATESATFTTGRSDTTRNDIARLVGKRFVSASENTADSLLDESLIKNLTGTEKVTARFLHKEHFEFYPECKIWWCFNHTPYLRDQTYAIERRLRLIPFEEKIPDAEQDKDLAIKLKEESNAIFNWMLEGLKEYQIVGLHPPARISIETKKYMENQDLLFDFVEDICIKEGSIRANELFQAYVNWCDYEHIKPMSSTKFGKLLIEKGFQRDRTNVGKYYTGISLKTMKKIQ